MRQPERSTERQRGALRRPYQAEVGMTQARHRRGTGARRVFGTARRAWLLLPFHADGRVIDTAIGTLCWSPGWSGRPDVGSRGGALPAQPHRLQAAPIRQPTAKAPAAARPRSGARRAAPAAAPTPAPAAPPGPRPRRTPPSALRPETTPAASPGPALSEGRRVQPPPPVTHSPIRQRPSGARRNARGSATPS